LFVASRELPNSSGELIATTNVLNTGVESTAQVVNPISIGRGIIDNASTGIDQDIRTFLSKPYPILNGTLGISDTVSTFPMLTVPSQIIQIPLFLNKLKGYLGIRATLVFRLQVNANRFQQGRYILAWTPMCGSQGSSVASSHWYNIHNHTLTQRTQLPHVELDLATDTQAILKIPYVSVLTHAPIVSTGSVGDIGVVQITPYSPLVAPAGSAIASYTLWVSFEDIHLAGAAVPQMARAFQAKVVPRSKNASETEQKEAGIGPLQSSMRVVSKVSDFIGTTIPFLSEFAMPVSWAANIVGGVASIFGWSKPLVLNPAERRKIDIFPYVTTMDSSDTAAPLSLSARNAVEVCPGFAGTDIDEMSIPFLISIPAFWANVAWTTSAVNGTALTTLSMNPRFFLNTSTSFGGTNVINYLPLGFLATCFGMYRGSVVLTFKLIKTEFHSGRLLLAFNPFHQPSGSGASYTITDSSYIHREIIDIRDGNEFSFTIPWTSLTSYKSTFSTDAIYGTVILFVLDELVAPATVSSTVNILVEVSGAKDFEFAQPINLAVGPVAGVFPQMADCFDPKPQSNPSSFISGVIGGSKVSEDELLNSRMAVGERILSLRSLLRATSVLAQQTSLSPSRFTNFLPYTLFFSNAYSTPAMPPVGGDYYSIIGSFYALSRGGVRFRAYDPTNSYQGFYTTVLQPVSSYASSGFNYSTTDFAGSSLNYRNNNPFVIQNFPHTGGMEVSVPQYHLYHSRANVDHFSVPTSGALTINLSTSSTLTRIGVSVDTNTPPINNLQFMRSMSDDGNFGMFVSIPPMYAITGTS
jgi:hypothetical protein